MKQFLVALTITAGLVSPSAAAAEGDVARGAQVYRACVACHALEPGLHLTGRASAVSGTGQRAGREGSPAIRTCYATPTFPGTQGR